MADSPHSDISPYLYAPMIKRLFIAFLFFTAYTVVLAHSIIPHHDDIETSTEQQHDKNHHHDNDDNALGHLFSHFQHIGTGNQFISTHQIASVKQSDKLQSDIPCLTSCNFKFYGADEPVTQFYPDDPHIYSSSGCSAFCLRGPPSITV